MGVVNGGQYNQLMMAGEEEYEGEEDDDIPNMVAVKETSVIEQEMVVEKQREEADGPLPQ